MFTFLSLKTFQDHVTCVRVVFVRIKFVYDFLVKVQAGYWTYASDFVIISHAIAMRQIKTRKPSWRKGKRATAVRVWSPLAKKSKPHLTTKRHVDRQFGCQVIAIFVYPRWPSAAILDIWNSKVAPSANPENHRTKHHVSMLYTAGVIPV